MENTKTTEPYAGLKAEVRKLEAETNRLSDKALKDYGYRYWSDVALPAIAEVHHQKVDAACQFHGLPARRVTKRFA